MKEAILELLKSMDEEACTVLAQTAKRMVDAFIKEGFTKSEAIELLTHVQGK